MVTTPSKPAPVAAPAKASAKKVPAVKPVTATKAAAKPAAKAAAKPVAKTVIKPAPKPATKPSAAKATTKKPVKPAASVHIDPAQVHLKASTAPKPLLTLDQRHHYVSVAAFYIAERRGFTLGNPAEDWLAAEAEVDRLIASGHFTP
jgi:hypothetical protein